VNRAISVVGSAVQADKANVATAPTFWHGVNSGAMADAEVTDTIAEVSTGLAAPSLAIREKAQLPTGFKTLAFAKAIGLYLYGVLGDIDTTGASAPYTHVITLADSLPWITFFGKLDTWLQSNGASKIDELTLEWDGPKPLWVTVVAQGCTFALPSSITPPATTEILGAFFTPVGGTFQADVDGSTLADISVLGGKITFKRGIKVDHFCAAITPGDIDDSGQIDATVELKVRVADLAIRRTILTGAANGTAIATTPIFGSFSVAFKSGTDTLTIAGTRVQFSAKQPEADVKGAPTDLALVGKMLAPDATTTPVTVTLVNSVAAYDS
jgi:hypothetical protein